MRSFAFHITRKSAELNFEIQVSSVATYPLKICFTQYQTHNDNMTIVS